MRLNFKKKFIYINKRKTVREGWGQYRECLLVLTSPAIFLTNFV